MRKKTIGILFITGVVIGILGFVLFFVGIIGSTTVYNARTGTNDVTQFANLPLFIIGMILYVLSFIAFTIAWIGALINLARLQQWAWFVLMFIFGGICLIVYLIRGPETPSIPSYQQAPNQPPQNYLS